MVKQAVATVICQTLSVMVSLTARKASKWRPEFGNAGQKKKKDSHMGPLMGLETWRRKIKVGVA